ncbi:type II toxin-antitoxin system HicA family toxin [Leptolyngbya sp. KIOST-1]|uniref:type II toxin-antitoxin system HicA family toxin n=1 Tax=Leptolyngbya sp. KIOST-1 TaxID=1229172 RepID=UPI000561BAF0|nr:type II toxin-antitoxin system HicA family toxin [Leptolyngbya sp. KIOST-1]
MTKRDKLRERLKNNPANARFSDIRKLLEYEGFTLDRVTGSHHIFLKDDITFVVPVHNNKVKTVGSMSGLQGRLKQVRMQVLT